MTDAIAAKPLICTPAYGGHVTVAYATSLAQLNPVPDMVIISSSLVTLARNNMMLRFLKGDWTHLFFIDADVGFKRENLIRLLRYDEDVVAAPYPFKNENKQGWPVEVAPGAEVDEHGFVRALYAATGFMCIKRRVFETMLQSGISHSEVFDTMRVGDEYFGEDVAFCKRWRGLGGAIHLDTKGPPLEHIGNKTFSRDFGEWFAQQAAPGKAA